MLMAKRQWNAVLNVYILEQLIVYSLSIMAIVANCNDAEVISSWNRHTDSSSQYFGKITPSLSI